MPDNKDYKFDKRAPSYDDGFEGRISGKFYALLLEQVQVEPDASVLDVGCGTGTILRRIAESVPIRGYGIDVEENMIVEAQKKCPEMDIRVSACENTPFENEQFDAITACMAYHHFDDRKGFAKEAARILKPKGILYICDPRFPWLIRKAINGASRLFRIAGFFGTPQEISENFLEYGFQFCGVAHDGYAQVVKLQLVG